MHTFFPTPTCKSSKSQPSLTAIALSSASRSHLIDATGRGHGLRASTDDARVVAFAGPEVLSLVCESVATVIIRAALRLCRT